MTEPRVLFVLKYREYQYENETQKDFLTSGLYNSASFVRNMLSEQGIQTHLVQVVDNNSIHRELVAFNATHVIIEAFWVVPEKFDELKRVCPNVKFIIRNHSETPFLAQEGIGFDWMLKYLSKSNVIMSCNAKRMLDDTRVLASVLYPSWDTDLITSRVPYLPNYYPLNDVMPRKSARKSSGINIGCFGAIRPLKNHMNQAIAAIRFAEKHNRSLAFHINYSRMEMNGEPILRNLRGIFEKCPDHQLIEYPWMRHVDFLTVLSKMDILSQVSFSETFNIVAADAVTQGIPLVSSSEIPWADPKFHAIPTSSVDIAEKLELAYFSESDYNVQGLRTYNEASIQEWVKYFKG